MSTQVAGLQLTLTPILEWHFPPIPGFPGNWRRHQFPGPGAVGFKRIALAEGLALGPNGSNNARGGGWFPSASGGAPGG